MKPICWYAQSQGDRNYQEDSCTVLQYESRTFLFVADGLGGHSNGDIASQLITKELESMVSALPIVNLEDYKTVLLEWFSTLILAFKDKLAAIEDGKDSHTTFALAIIDGADLFTIHVGDSRVYHSGRSELWRTKDHSVLQMLLRDGEITEEEMATHPEQGKLYKSLSLKKDARPTISHRELHSGDTVFVCSDGFWEGFSAAELGAVVGTAQSHEAIQELVDLAAKNRAPKADNVTLVATLNLEVDESVHEQRRALVEDQLTRSQDEEHDEHNDFDQSQIATPQSSYDDQEVSLEDVDVSFNDLDQPELDTDGVPVTPSEQEVDSTPTPTHNPNPTPRVLIKKGPRESKLSNNTATKDANEGELSFANNDDSSRVAADEPAVDRLKMSALKGSKLKTRDLVRDKVIRRLLVVLVVVLIALAFTLGSLFGKIESVQKNEQPEPERAALTSSLDQTA